VFADWISPVAVAMISPSSSMRPISEKRAGWSCGAVSGGAFMTALCAYIPDYVAVLKVILSGRRDKGQQNAD
jgi:hypothetical protein